MKSEFVKRDGIITIIFHFERALDHRQIVEMAETVESAIEQHDELRLLLDLRDTESFEVGAFASAKGLSVSLKSIGPVRRYAVVGAPGVVEFAVETFGKLLPLESCAFGHTELEDAMLWVSRPLD